MNIVWLFPPSSEGFPNISQYRFFKRMPIRISIIYPYLAATGATLLKKAGHQVKFFDCPTMNLTWESIYPYLVNADLIVMEARTPIMPQIWQTCQQLKQDFPQAKIALYGDHVTWNPEESLPYADFIVCGGDFDNGILTLADNLNESPRILQAPFIENLDHLPYVDRQLVPWELYYESWRHRDRFFWTMSARGCTYHCTFCAWAETLWQNRIRYRSPSNVAEEFGQLWSEYGDCEILDDADLFDTSWGAKFAKALIQKGYNNKEILWAFQTHPNMIHNSSDLELMHQAGLRTVKLGIESGNQKTLSLIKKNTTIHQIERAISLLKETDIMVHTNLMVGWPWETRKEAYHTIDWIKKLDPNQAQFSMVIPYPNTELFRMAKREGWLSAVETDWASFDASHPMLKMEGMTSEEVVQLYQDCWRQFYFDRKYIWNHIKSVRHWEGVKQLYRGFRSVYYGHMRAVEA